MTDLTLTAALLGPILARTPAAPLITYYDDGDGTRAELSALTLANWAAKTANYIRDEAGLEPGSLVAISAPPHWQTAAALLGVWWADTEVALDTDPDAELAITAVDRVATGPPTLVLSLDAFGQPVRQLPPGTDDFVESVRAHGDQFIPAPNPAGQPFSGQSTADVLAAAQKSAAAQGISEGDRVLSSAAWDSPQSLIGGLLAVLAAGASLVYVANPDPDAREKRIAAERVTVS